LEGYKFSIGRVELKNSFNKRGKILKRMRVKLKKIEQKI
jgi:hypothetical protein